MRAHFVDTLLARLEGAVSPIWITMVFVTDAPPETPALREAWETLFERTPRLRHAWCDRDGWTPQRWTRDTLRRSLCEWPQAGELQAWLTTLAAQPAALEQMPALRLDVGRVLVDGRPRYAIAARLHHALGDARALGRTLARYWRLLRGHDIPVDPSPQVLMRDRDLWLWAARHPRGLAGLREGRRRLLSRRALALPVDGRTLGRPVAHHTTVEFAQPQRTRVLAEMFLAAVLVASAKRIPDREGTLRLRMPVDLSASMGWDAALGNTCMAIPLEFPLEHVRARVSDADALQRLVRDTIDEALREQRPLVCALEAYFTARVLPKALLRRGAAAGFFDTPRTNTLVTTFVGRLDNDLRDVPFDVQQMISHTSTWGAHAWSVGSRMGLNVTSFEGLWHRSTLAAFAGDATAWMIEHGLAQPCSAGPLWEAA